VVFIQYAAVLKKNPKLAYEDGNMSIELTHILIGNIIFIIKNKLKITNISDYNNLRVLVDC
jgi:hypothetical protein